MKITIYHINLYILNYLFLKMRLSIAKLEHLQKVFNICFIKNSYIKTSKIVTKRRILLASLFIKR